MEYILVVDLWTIFNAELNDLAKVVKLPFWIQEFPGLDISWGPFWAKICIFCLQNIDIQ